MKPTDFTLEELLADLREQSVPDDGYLRAQEWAELWRVGMERARDSIRKLLAAGRMEARERMDTRIDGKACRIKVYGLVAHPKEEQT